MEDGIEYARSSVVKLHRMVDNLERDYELVDQARDFRQELENLAFYLKGLEGLIRDLRDNEKR